MKCNETDYLTVLQGYWDVSREIIPLAVSAGTRLCPSWCDRSVMLPDHLAPESPESEILWLI